MKGLSTSKARHSPYFFPANTELFHQPKYSTIYIHCLHPIRYRYTGRATSVCVGEGNVLAAWLNLEGKTWNTDNPSGSRMDTAHFPPSFCQAQVQAPLLWMLLPIVTKVGMGPVPEKLAWPPLACPEIHLRHFLCSSSHYVPQELRPCWNHAGKRTWKQSCVKAWLWIWEFPAPGYLQLLLLPAKWQSCDGDPPDETTLGELLHQPHARGQCELIERAPPASPPHCGQCGSSTV